MVDVYNPNESRKVAVRELLLTERHHLSYPESRCSECEQSHLDTASALMSEAFRMKGGNDKDYEISTKIDKLDISTPQKELQEEIRTIRKEINGLRGVKDCDKQCSRNLPKSTNSVVETEEEEGLTTGKTAFLVIGALGLGIILYNIFKK